MDDEKVFLSLAVLLPELSIFSVGSVSAQEYRGRIQGMVTDRSKAVVVGGAVTLRTSKTGISAVRSTDSSGSYLFDLVEPGIYSLVVELAGFSRFLQENLLVENLLFELVGAGRGEQFVTVHLPDLTPDDMVQAERTGGTSQWFRDRYSWELAAGSASYSA